MCILNHVGYTAHEIATPDLGCRVFAHHSEIGLSYEQLTEIGSLAADWRYRHAEMASEMVRLGNDIDRLLNVHNPDVAAVKELAVQRRELIARSEDDFVDIWAQMSAVMDDGQYGRAMQTYRKEFENQPHPVLGTDAWEAPPLAAASTASQVAVG